MKSVWVDPEIRWKNAELNEYKTAFRRQGFTVLNERPEDGGLALVVSDKTYRSLGSISDDSTLILVAEPGDSLSSWIESDYRRRLTYNAMPDELVQLVSDLDRIHFLAGQVKRLEVAQKSWAGQSLFKELDANHIIDQVLRFVSDRIEVVNVIWVKWEDFKKLKSLGREEAYVEWEIRSGLESPGYRALHRKETSEALDQLLSHLSAEDISKLGRHEAVIHSRDSETLHLWVSAGTDRDNEPLGVVWMEGLGVEMWPHILEPLNAGLAQLAPSIGFGLKYWEAKSQSMVDDLTQLNNQRFLLPVLRSEISRARRHKRSFSVLFFDLDHFKALNDTHGHWIGSRLLCAMGDLVRSSIRTCDFGFRYGGDEFVIVLPDAPKESAYIVAERLRSAVEQSRFDLNGIEIRLTASVGVAAFPDHVSTAEELIQMADQAMYEAKRRQRNFVYMAS